MFKKKFKSKAYFLIEAGAGQKTGAEQKPTGSATLMLTCASLGVVAATTDAALLEVSGRLGRLPLLPAPLLRVLNTHKE